MDQKSFVYTLQFTVLSAHRITSYQIHRISDYKKNPLSVRKVMETTCLVSSRQHLLKTLHQSPNRNIHMLVLTVLSYTSIGNQFKEHNFVKTAGQLLLSFCIVQTQCKCQKSQTVYSVRVSLKWTNLQCHKTLNFASSRIEAHLGILEYQICSSILLQIHYFNLLLGKKYTLSSIIFHC